MLCIIGASGSGKSTLLRLINRMYEVDSGQIAVFDQNIKNSSSTLLRRKIGYVLQQPGLFPHWTVGKNIGLVPRLNNQPESVIESRVDELLNLVHMPPNIYRNRYPAELSGGQQQRVGIARALAAKPQLMLFDEPFSALDPITRAELQSEVKNLKVKLNLTGIFVTHDVREAFALGDKIIILNEGKVVQTGTPDEIKANPKNEYVRQFIGDEADA
ncbi:ATP-binding cassette domain-containing protein [Cryomorpha ignava]|uniref:ATP-binding cassette domain-containing protein n=2 Tax=Cryomorpha ignava TaxID=101383 RepID=A0A7K3WWG1_9FLAO|nr:ATP-binding cassette domain-containing protein [Cryomorpha ignava]